MIAAVGATAASVIRLICRIHSDRLRGRHLDVGRDHAESTLSFLGLGSTRYPTWGRLVNAKDFGHRPHWAVRGRRHFLTVLAINSSATDCATRLIQESCNVA